ncbi:Na(+)/H(+) antiporter [Apiospora arundinis]|uniref:Na(+)/H(+) antiporter n=1 Tax=Apiospora arundinis TaxID=335852 RepID=A0ABR2J3K2_9PEZI
MLTTVRGLLAGALSIFVHGLSIPALKLIYKFYGVQPLVEDAVKIKCVSIFIPTTVNAIVNGSQNYLVYNLFSRPAFNQCKLLLWYDRRRHPAHRLQLSTRLPGLQL